MSEVSAWGCSNCGSPDFVDVAPNKRRCAHCGSIFTLRETPAVVVKCLRCGFDNEPEARYCSNCGAPLGGWAPPERKKLDPATVSIMVTVFGFLVFPVGGAIVGLVLGYKALRDAQESGGRTGSEKLARTAIYVGWGGIALSVLPLCLFVGMSGVGWGCSLIEELFQAAGNAF